MAKMLVSATRYDTLELLAAELMLYEDTAWSQLPESARNIQIKRSAEKIEKLLGFLRES